MLLQTDWLWENLKIDNNNAQGEYYLTDLVQMAVEQEKIAILQIAIECLENRPEEWKWFKKCLRNMSSKGQKFMTGAEIATQAIDAGASMIMAIRLLQ